MPRVFTVVFDVPHKGFKFNIRFLFYFPRYITVAYFLNDVDDGGEVVLPLANSKFEVFHLMLPSFVVKCLKSTQRTKRLVCKEAVALRRRECKALI